MKADKLEKLHRFSYQFQNTYFHTISMGVMCKTHLANWEMFMMEKEK